MDARTKAGRVALGSELRRLRVAAGWTLRDAALACGLKHSNLAGYEAARVPFRPGALWLLRYLEKLGVSEEEAKHVLKLSAACGGWIPLTERAIDFAMRDYRRRE